MRKPRCVSACSRRPGWSSAARWARCRRRGPRPARARRKRDLGFRQPSAEHARHVLRPACAAGAACDRRRALESDAARPARGRVGGRGARLRRADRLPPDAGAGVAVCGVAAAGRLRALCDGHPHGRRGGRKRTRRAGHARQRRLQRRSGRVDHRDDHQPRARHRSPGGCLSAWRDAGAADGPRTARRHRRHHRLRRHRPLRRRTGPGLWRATARQHAAAGGRARSPGSKCR